MGEAWNFAVFGDMRSNDPNDGSGVNTTAVTAIATDVSTNRDADFVLVVGDLVYGNGSTTSIADQLANFKNAMSAGGMKVAGESGSKVPYYPIRGNHDSNVVDTSGTAWKLAFGTLPQNGPTTNTAGGGNSEVGMTYSFTHNNSLFLALDQFINSATYPDQVNQTWVDGQLNGSTADHVFAYGHEPAYQAVHADCLAAQAAARDAFLTSLYEHNGLTYFAGHDHLSAFARAELGGDASKLFYSIIDGAGGAPFYSFDGTYVDPNVTGLYFNSADSVTPYYTYTLVTVDNDLLWMRLYGTADLSSPAWLNLFAIVISGTLVTDTSTLTSSVENDSAINFYQTSNGTYSSVISGIGTITKSGNAILTLSGVNTYLGNTIVDAGTLNVTGSISGSAVTVNPSGTLKGTGTIYSLTNNGIVAPGNSVGTLNLNGGAFTQGPTGTLEIEVDSAASFDKIAGASTATLGGTLKTITIGTYSVGTTLATVIATTGGVSGGFAILNTPITPTIVWKPQVNGTNLDLVATRDYNNYPLRTALTTNGQNVAAAMESVLPSASGDLATVKNTIDGLASNSAVAEAYSQISPEGLSGISTMAFTNATMQFSNLQSHMSELRTGVARGMSFNGYTGAFAGNLAGQDNRVLIAYEGDDWAKFARRSNEESGTDKQFGFFVNGEGNFGDQDVTSNQPGFNYQSGGVTAGFDYKLLNGLIVGCNAGYSRTGSSISGDGGSIDIDSISYGIYGTYSYQSFYLDMATEFSSNFYDTDRKIIFGGMNRDAEGDPFGQQWTVAAGTGWDLHVKDLVTGPTATFKYSQLWVDSFTESGADSLDLNVSAENAASCQLGLGWRAEYEVKIGKYSLFPEAHISYQHEFLNDSRSIEASLANVTFAAVTDDPTRDFALLGCGMALRVTNAVLLNVGYQAQVGTRRYVAQNLNGSLKAYF